MSIQPPNASPLAIPQRADPLRRATPQSSPVTAVKAGNAEPFARQRVLTELDGMAPEYHAGGYRADGSARPTAGGRGAVLDLFA